MALAVREAFLLVRDRSVPGLRRAHAGWLGALLAPILPLAAWYAYHFHRTGFVFGNPEYLRYNATANLDAQRIALCLYHRLLHLTMHMNLFVPVLCAVADAAVSCHCYAHAPPRPVLNAIVVVLMANWIAFSVLGGALLTRYLLPMYPLVLLVCVGVWHRRMRSWIWIAALSAAAFLAGLWINPPYAFAPEDNLTYRDMIVLHQRAVALIARAMAAGDGADRVACHLRAGVARTGLHQIPHQCGRDPKLLARADRRRSTDGAGRGRPRRVRHRPALLHQVGAAARGYQPGPWQRTN